jgi:hypothetical protein
MAGKRQHFVPRFLQAGFAIKKTADDHVRSSTASATPVEAVLRGETPKDFIINRVVRIVHTHAIHTLDCPGLSSRVRDVFENGAVLLCDSYSKIANSAPLVRNLKATGECAAGHFEYRQPFTLLTNAPT